MNEFVRVAAETLPSYRRELIESCLALAQAGDSLMVNDYVQEEIRVFLKKLKRDFPELKPKQIPEYQALVGGGETAVDEHEPEMLQEILDRVMTFVEAALAKKEKLEGK